MGASFLAPGRAFGCTPGARELLRQGQVHRAGGHEDIALRRLTDALTLDPYCQEAYLALGELRQQLGHFDEAVVVYTQALARAATLDEALLGRALAHRALGERDKALEDLVHYAQGGEAARLEVLATFYGEYFLGLAQLATWRRIHGLALASGDEPLARRSAVMVRALQWVTAPGDAVAYPASATPFRHLVAATARRFFGAKVPQPGASP